MNSEGMTWYQEKEAQQMEENIDIPFPFQPYPAQQALMQQLYSTFEKGHVGLFESPTGTGKSLSLICASLHWLKERQQKDDAGVEDLYLIEKKKRREQNVEEVTCTTSGKRNVEPDWLRNYGEEKRRTDEQRRLEMVRERRRVCDLRLQTARNSSDRLTSLRSDLEAKAQQKKHKWTGASKLPDKKIIDNRKKDAEDDDEDLLPVYYASENEGNDDNEDLWSDSGDEAADKRKEIEEDQKETDDEAESLDRSTLKILYCSRTHSQVSQFVMEIQKTAFAENVRVISLSSRKNLCINEEVLQLGNDTRISDRCLDMQKGKATVRVEAAAVQQNQEGTKKQKIGRRVRSVAKKCPYLQSSLSSLQSVYRDHALSRVQNLEDLAELGKKIGTCAYYGTRKAVAQAELICMPYATLLHKQTRESMNIPLEDNIVLIDEAHNLIEAVNAVHTNYLPLHAIDRALSQVILYWERYNARLSGKNAYYVQQIIRVIKGLMDFIRSKAPANASPSSSTTGTSQLQADEESSALGSEVMSVNQLLFEAGIDNINLFKVARYMEQSQISKKVLGFAERRLAEVKIHPLNSKNRDLELDAASAACGGNASTALNEEDEYVSNHVSSLQIMESFLVTLTGSNQDGRIVVDTGRGPKTGRRRSNAGLKYIVLNAATHFKDIVQKARSVILIGGTLQPVAPIVSQLFPNLSAERIDVFSCGHVIPPENLTAMCLTRGPTNVEFDFTHKSRIQPSQMDELGRLLLNVCTVAPGGAVVFLPSYQYEEIIFQRWRETGMLYRLQNKKAIFTEPKRAKDVDTVLQAYAQCIKGSSGRGALLFCVVGAKMSEGINFSDEMARCVVMVGLPYPDRRDPELQQKLQYLDGLKGQASDTFGSVSGKSYYQNLCMRAVNQSIGRAIRHAQDWSAILLVDRRYFSDSSIIPLLPKWIADRVLPYSITSDFRSSFKNLIHFFRTKES